MPDEIPPITPAPEIPPAQNQPPIQAPPPAAHLVVTGEKSEREVELERQLADTSEQLTAAQRKTLEREREIAERERELQTLRGETPAPTQKVKRKKIQPTFFHADEDEEE